MTKQGGRWGIIVPRTACANECRGPGPTIASEAEAAKGGQRLRGTEIFDPRTPLAKAMWERGLSYSRAISADGPGEWLRVSLEAGFS